MKKVFSGQSAMCDLENTRAHLGSLLSHYHLFVIWKLISDKTVERAQRKFKL